MTRIRDVLTTRGRAFMAAGLTLLLGGFLLGVADVTRVGLLLASLPLLAAMVARRRIDDLRVTRRIYPAQVSVGQSARVELVLRNTSQRRTRTQFAEERLPRPLGAGQRFVLPAMEPSDVREVDYEIRYQVRGRYRLGPLMLRVRDPYGLATVAASLPGSTDILVLPRVEPLGTASPRADGMGADGAIPHIVVQHGEDDVAVRSFRNGDDLRRIHWPATAHRSQLMVRLEDRPVRRRAVIVLDSRADEHQGSPTSGSFEWAVTAAASTAAHLARRRYVINLVSLETIADGTATRPVEIDSVLASLAVAQLGGTQQLDDVLQCAHTLTAGGLVIAIVTGHDEGVLRRITALRHPDGTGLMFLLDSAGFARQAHLAPGAPGAPGAPAAPADQTLALAAVAAMSGWSTCVVGPGMTVAQAWNAVSGGVAVKAGARR